MVDVKGYGILQVGEDSTLKEIITIPEGKIYVFTIWGQQSKVLHTQFIPTSNISSNIENTV